MTNIVNDFTPPPMGRVISPGEAKTIQCFPRTWGGRLSMDGWMQHVAVSGTSEGVLWCCDVTKERPVIVADYGTASEACMTVAEVFAATVRRHEDVPALYWRTPTQQAQAAKLGGSAGEWSCMTWQAYWSMTCQTAKALIHSKLPSRGRVCLYGQNAPAWFIGTLATIFAHGIAVGVYTTNGPDAVAYILETTECEIIFIDTVDSLRVINQARRRGRAKCLRVVVMYVDSAPQQRRDCEDKTAAGTRPDSLATQKNNDDEGGEARTKTTPFSQLDVVTFENFLKRGDHVSDEVLRERMDLCKAGECCELVFTSGTTGDPKGVMLSHDNLLWSASQCVQSARYTAADSLISYLPLSHIAGQVIDLYIPLSCGLSVFFAPPDALKGTLMECVREVQPTYFFAPPRVWEKIEEKMKGMSNQTSGMRKQLSEWAKGVGTAGVSALLAGTSPPVGFGTARKLVLNRVKAALGFSRCRMFGAGAAPLRQSTQEYFYSLGIVICDMYGMSESPGPATINTPAPGRFKIGTPGQPLSGTEFYIDKPDRHGHGEICWRGRNVFMGYYKNVDATRACIDPQTGFLHSGDIGYIDSDGFLFITSRIKELIITAGGENVPPVLVENLVKETMPFVSNCVVVGEKKPYLAVLLTLKTELDGDQQPTNQIAQDVHFLIQQQQRHRINANALSFPTSTSSTSSPPTASSPSSDASMTVEDAAKSPVLHELIDDAIKRVNSKSVSRAQHLRKWAILPKDFTIADGDLTPTLKLKRKVVAEKYEHIIETLYPPSSKI